MELPVDPIPESVGAGRYRRLAPLDQGGQRRVFRAYDSRLDRPVVLSMFHGSDATALAKIDHESALTSRIGEHPGLALLQDVGREGEHLYVVRPYAMGGDLASRLDRAEGGRLPEADVIRLAGDLARALVYLHSRHVVHRDIKPANVWFDAEGNAMLSDFGLAIEIGPVAKTRAPGIVGTAAYMPPEQALGGEIDARSDLYALGGMLYEAAVGRLPFEGETTPAMILHHIRSVAELPSRLRADVSEAFSAFVMSLLEKDPARRPQSAAAVCASLGHMVEAARRKGNRPIPLPDAAVQRIFVGREEELVKLHAALDDARAGRGRLVVLAGEAGIGKTRLTEELSSRARSLEVRVLVGHCYDGEGAPAYWPWIQMLRDHAESRDPAELAAEMGPGAADIAQIVPVVKSRLPGLEAPASLQPDEARFRLFDSVGTFLRRTAKASPLVLILEDLHWADRSSLQLLDFLAPEIARMVLLVVVTYRDAEVDPSHPLAWLLGRLPRAPGYERIRLSGLTEHQLQLLLDRLAGRPVPSPFVRAIHSETEGNPFFVLEMLRHLIEEGIVYFERDRWTSQVNPLQLGMPAGVREVIARRLAHLSEACRRVLAVAAVLGRDFGVETLGRLVHEEKLDALLEEARGARLIEEREWARPRFRFSHALVREVLYVEIDAAERARLHGQAGEALEELHAADLEPHLGALAHHFCQAAPAGHPEKAIAYAERAAARATALTGYAEAAEHYERALDLLAVAAPADSHRRGTLLRDLGAALMKAGESERAREIFQETAEIGRRIGSKDLLVDAALGYGGLDVGGLTTQVGIVDRDHIELLEEALAALGDGHHVRRAIVLSQLAMALYFTGARERGEGLSLEAVETARALGDPATLAHALHARHYATWGPLNVEERLTESAEIIALADRAGSRALELTGRTWRIASLLEVGRLAEMEREFDAWCRAAAETRHPLQEWFACLHRAMRALLRGDFQEAEPLIHRAVAEGQRSRPYEAVQGFGTQLLTLRSQCGGLETMLPTVEGFVAKYPGMPGWRCALTWANALTGRDEPAKSEVRRMADLDFAELPRDRFWLVAMCLLAEAAARVGEAEAAQRLYPHLLPFEGRNLVIGFWPAACFGSIDRYLGLLARTAERYDTADLHLRRALERNERLGARGWAAQVVHEMGELLLARGRPEDREQATALLDRALHEATRMGMCPLTERILAQKLRAQGSAMTSLRSSIDVVSERIDKEPPDLERHAAPDGTVTLLFSDMVGFTEMTVRLGDERAHAVIREHNAIVRRETARHGGFEVEVEGDGFLLAFSSAVAGLRCAVSIQRAFEAYRVEHPEQPTHVRIGIHTGEAIRQGRSFFGGTVIRAARIAGSAGADEILISGVVRDLLRGVGDVRIGSGREIVLKGFSAPEQVFPISY
jgi:predicted ATPase/class 3 adenylate cyclase